MPSFAIEAPGEAYPLTEDLVLKTLRDAAGGSPQKVQVASQQLTNWETHLGYWSALQDVYVNLENEQNIRFMAIILLKNGIDKFWRKTSVNRIDKNEKAKVKSRVIEAGVKEPVSQLVLHNALVLAKIVRLEFPHEWPEVITVLIDRLRNPLSDVPHLANTLTMTLQVIKELATARLQRSRESLRKAAPELFHVLATIYNAQLSSWVEYLQSGGTVGVWNPDSMVLSYLTIKATRRLVVAGFAHPHRDTDVASFWSTLMDQLGQLWQMTRNESLMQPGSHAEIYLPKNLIQIAKLHQEMAIVHPASFVLLPECIALLESYWQLVKTQGSEYELEGPISDWQVLESGTRGPKAPLLEVLALKALIIFRAALRMVFNPVQTFKYQHPEDKIDRADSVAKIKSELLVDDFVVEVMETIITQFFVLRAADLREWLEEPSEWEKQEEGLANAWELSLRGCAEKVFLDLLINYKELLIPRLLQIFHMYTAPGNPQVFLKDSVYTALGLSAAVIHPHLDFNSFMTVAVVPDMQYQDRNYTILRRRTAILLGQWAPVISETINSPLVYQLFAELLSPGPLNDHVVRVTAGRQLRAVLEPYDFSYAKFAPYATTLLENLLIMIKETELIETKMALLETVSLAVTQMETHIAPFADGIFNTLPGLWEESGDEHMMKQSILSLIDALISSLTKSSVRYHPLVLPFIHTSVQPGSDVMAYLLEEAMEVWRTLVKHTPSENPSPDLLALCQSLLPLLEMGSDSLRPSFDVLESYILLSPSTVLEATFLRSLLTSFNTLLGAGAGTSGGRREISRVTGLIALFIKSLNVARNFANKDLQLQAGQHLVSHLVETSVLSSLLALIKETYDYNQDGTSGKDTPSLSGPSETDLFNVLAQIAILDSSIFIQAISAAAGSSCPSWLTSEWIRHFDEIGDVTVKKLHAIALTSLYLISQPSPTFMLDHLPSMMSLWTDILGELGYEAPEETMGDYLWNPDLHSTGHGQPAAAVAAVKSEWANENEALEEDRTLELQKTERIYTINLVFYVTEALHGIIVGVGGPRVFKQRSTATIDSSIREALVKVLISSSSQTSRSTALEIVLDCLGDAV